MNRLVFLEQLAETTEWDVIVIGGGAIGVGTALDSASRGFKTLLLEQYDFGKGTSSKSTKLIHGGVRYLQQGNIRLVREALKERGLLLKNAPHVCKPLPILVPTRTWLEKLFYGLGLKLYYYLSSRFRLGSVTFKTERDLKLISSGIKSHGLSGGVVFFDGQFDDTRLLIDLVKKAASFDACILNYAQVLSFLKEKEKVSGVMFKDILSGKEYIGKGKVVINATGSSVDEVAKLENPNAAKTQVFSTGIHLVVDAHFFPGEHALLVPRTDDGRVFFVIPWYGKVLIGTTDNEIDSAEIELSATKSEVDFVIEHFNRYCHKEITRGDVRSVFVGVRSLVNNNNRKKGTRLISRDHTIRVSSNGLISVSGGKWTTYRKIAQDVVDQAIFIGNLRKANSNTEDLRLYGEHLGAGSLGRLDIYGAYSTDILRLLNEGYNARIHERLPYTTAEIVWMTRNEMAMTVEDILARRTRSLFIDTHAAIEAAPLVASLMSEVFKASKSWEEQQVVAFKSTAMNYMVKV